MNTNTYTPSKQLLSKITGQTIEDIKPQAINYYGEQRLCYTYQSVVVHKNIYELAIKTKQKYPSLDLNLAATDISEFWRRANILGGEAK